MALCTWPFCMAHGAGAYLILFHCRDIVVLGVVGRYIVTYMVFLPAPLGPVAEIVAFLKSTGNRR